MINDADGSSKTTAETKRLIAAVNNPCKLKVTTATATYESYDPYTFASSISVEELYLFGEGRLKQAYKTFGAQAITLNNVTGVRFAVWAPNAERVSVVGSLTNGMDA